MPHFVWVCFLSPRLQSLLKGKVSCGDLGLIDFVKIKDFDFYIVLNKPQKWSGLHRGSFRASHPAAMGSNPGSAGRFLPRFVFSILLSKKEFKLKSYLRNWLPRSHGLVGGLWFNLRSLSMFSPPRVNTLAGKNWKPASRKLFSVFALIQKNNLAVKPGAILGLN